MHFWHRPIVSHTATSIAPFTGLGMSGCRSLPVGLFYLCDVTLQALNVCFQSLAAGLGLGGSFLCLLLPSAALTGTLCQSRHLCLLGSVQAGNLSTLCISEGHNILSFAHGSGCSGPLTMSGA